jgi:hypothetical protein
VLQSVWKSKSASHVADTFTGTGEELVRAGDQEGVGVAAGDAGRSATGSRSDGRSSAGIDGAVMLS